MKTEEKILNEEVEAMRNEAAKSAEVREPEAFYGPFGPNYRYVSPGEIGRGTQSKAEAEPVLSEAAEKSARSYGAALGGEKNQDAAAARREAERQKQEAESVKAAAEINFGKARQENEAMKEFVKSQNGGKIPEEYKKFFAGNERMIDKFESFVASAAENASAAAEKGDAAEAEHSLGLAKIAAEWLAKAANALDDLARNIGTAVAEALETYRTWFEDIYIGFNKEVAAWESRCAVMADREADKLESKYSRWAEVRKAAGNTVRTARGKELNSDEASINAYETERILGNRQIAESHRNAAAVYAGKAEKVQSRQDARLERFAGKAEKDAESGRSDRKER